MCSCQLLRQRRGDEDNDDDSKQRECSGAVGTGEGRCLSHRWHSKASSVYSAVHVRYLLISAVNAVDLHTNAAVAMRMMCGPRNRRKVCSPEPETHAPTIAHVREISEHTQRWERTALWSLVVNGAWAAGVRIAQRNRARRRQRQARQEGERECVCVRERHTHRDD